MTGPLRRLISGLLIAVAVATPAAIGTPRPRVPPVKTANIGWPLCPLYQPGDWMWIFLDCDHAPKPSPEG